jgi:hypothetical protein
LTKGVEQVTAANETLDQPVAAEGLSGAIETPDEPEVVEDAPIATETFSEPTVAEVAPEVSESAPQANQLPAEPTNSTDPQSQPTEEQVAEVPVSPVDAPPPVEPPAVDEPSSASTISGMSGTPDYLIKFTEPTKVGNSRIVDDGMNVGIGTAEPQQALDVNGLEAQLSQQ